MGRDITIVPEKDENGNIMLGECNQESGRYFPGGPTCPFCGKTYLLCSLFHHLAGSVTADILENNIENLDEQHVFDHDKDE